MKSEEQTLYEKKCPKILIFVVIEKGVEKFYRSDKVHELPERYVTFPEHWDVHLDKLAHYKIAI